MDNSQISNQAGPISSEEIQQNFMKNTSNIIYAGFFRRAFANFIDSFFTGILGWIISFALGTDYIISMSVGTLINIVYTTLFDSSELQGTPGKAILGIAIATENKNERISFQSALIRHFCKYISAATLFIGYLMQPFTQKRQTLHDLLTKTVVIRKDPGTIKYLEAFKNNFSKVLNGD